MPAETVPGAATARAKVAAATALVGTLALVFYRPLTSTLYADGYMVLYVGRWIAQHGLPHQEALTVMAHGRAWIDQQWLADATFYGLWKLGGYAWVSVAALVSAALAPALLARLMIRRGASLALTLGCCTLVVLTTLGYTIVRAQDFALPLFALVLILCVEDADRPRPSRRLLALVPLLALWANLHGSALLAAALAATYLAYRALLAARDHDRRAAVSCLALAAATALTPLATPYGADIIGYYGRFRAGGAVAKLTLEWAPPGPPSLGFFQLCIPALIVAGALVRWAPRGLARSTRILIVASTLTGVAAGLERRNVIWFGMVAAVLLADLGRERARRPVRRTRALWALGAAAATLAAVDVAAVLGAPSARFQGMPTATVRAVTTYAAAHPCVRILGDNMSSSALLWHDPSLAGRVAFDARLEAYGRSALQRWTDYLAAGGRGWTNATIGYDVLVGTNQALVRRLGAFPPGLQLSRQRGAAAVIRPGARCAPPIARPA